MRDDAEPCRGREAGLSQRRLQGLDGHGSRMLAAVGNP